MIKRVSIALCVAVVCLVAGCGNPGTVGNLTSPPAAGVEVTTASLPSGIVGQTYNQTLTAKNGTAPYTFSVTQGLIPPGFVLYANGVLSGTPSNNGTYTFTILVTDANKQQATASVTMTVAPPLTVTTTSLPAGLINLAYSAQIAAVNGTAPYSFAVTSGTIPTGLTLTPGGLLSGTPTVAGTFGFTVTATDSAGVKATATQTYSVVIATPQLVISGTGLPVALLNTAYSTTLGISGGLAPYTVTVSGTVPKGLTVSTAGAVSGTPTVGGSYSFGVTIADSEAQPQTIQATVTVTVAAPATVQVNATQTVATIPVTAYGIHTAVYDGELDDGTKMAPLLKIAGIQTLRYPGGSYGDSYHWAQFASTPIYGSTNPACNVIFNAYLAPNTDFGNFVHTLQTVGSQALITINYGTSVSDANADTSVGVDGNKTCSEPNTYGQPQEAAAWVAYANGSPGSTQVIGVDGVGFDWKTVGFWASLRAATPLSTDDGYNFLRIGQTAPIGVKNWEVGNEMYYNGWDGNRNFEDDLHAPYVYPGGYAGGTYNSRAGVTALGPTAYGTNAIPFIQAMKAVDPTIKIGVDFSSPIVDPIDLSWNPDLAQAVCAGTNFDIAIIHYYPGTYQDVHASEMLSDPQSDLPTLMAGLKTQLATYCPANAANIQYFITETGENGTIDPSTPQPVVGLYALNIFMNGLEAGYSNVDWLELHNGTFLDDNENPGPAFYGIQIAHNAAGVGDAVVQSSSDTASVIPMATVKTDGTKGFVLINADPQVPAQVLVKVSGTTLGTAAMQYSYGVGTTQTGAALVGASVGIAGNNFYVVVPPYTAVELIAP